MIALDHPTIDARLRRLVEAVVMRIDRDPALRQTMEQNVARWPDARARARWVPLLGLPWPDLRARLLEDSPVGAQLRQDAPLGGLLAPADRARLMRAPAHDPRAA